MSSRQAPYRRSLAQIAGTVLNVFDFAPNGDPAAVTDWWDPIRNAVQFLKESGGGKLIFPVWEYTVLYDPTSPAVRDSTTGVIDLSPWEDDGGTWHATQNIEIRFENGAVLKMDNLTGNGYDAQTHAVYARAHWVDVNGDPTPDTWSGYAVGYSGIKLVNVRVEWTLGSARGIGDSFRFTGTKTRATAPSGVVLENCSAYNAPQVGAIFMGCKQVDVRNFYAEDCFADTVHFNACYDGCSVNGVKAVDCGDDTVAVVTYYPDVITLARGLDTEEGPFTSPDQETANNNGIIVQSVQKIGGRANGVRLLGANRAKVTGVSVDAASSVDVGAAVWVGSVLANGTALAESGLAAKLCEVSKISAKGCNVGVHIVCLGMTGGETDAWLRNEVLVRGVSATECIQVSIWGQATRGFVIDGSLTDDVKCDFSDSRDFRLNNMRLVGGELVITGEATSYAELDIDTMPWHNIEIGNVRVDRNRMLVTDVRGLIVDGGISIYDAPASGFEGVRLSDFICPKLRVINANRDGVADLAHIPVRCIPGHRWKVNAEIDHDTGTTQNLIEVGGGDVYNISRDVRIYATAIHEVSGLGDDPWEIQGATYAPVNFWRTSRCRAEGTWGYVNTDDLPLGIVPEITAAEISGVKTLKVFDALAVYATGVLNVLATALATAAVYAARQIRFLQFVGDEGSAGVLDYGQLDANALSIHGKGTSGTNRLIKLFDNVEANGNITASSTVQGANVIVTDTTGSQPARLDSSKRVKGGKIALTDANDISLGSIPDGSLLQRSGNVVGGASALTANRVVATIGTGGALSVLAAMTSGNPVVGAGDGTITSATWTDVYNNIKASIQADFPDFAYLALNYVTAADYGAHTHSISDHTHGGVTAGAASTSAGGSGTTGTP